MRQEITSDLNLAIIEKQNLRNNIESQIQKTSELERSMLSSNDS